MLIIRLTRTGKKNAPRFRIVLVEKTAPPKTGKFLDILGNYNPESKDITLNKEQIKYWLSKGAQTSETVHNMLVKQGVIKGPKIKKKFKSKKKKTETAEEKTEPEKKPEEKTKPEEKPKEIAETDKEKKEEKALIE